MQGLETRESCASAVADKAGALFLVTEGGNVMGRSILQSWGAQAKGAVT